MGKALLAREHLINDTAKRPQIHGWGLGLRFLLQEFGTDVPEPVIEGREQIVGLAAVREAIESFVLEELGVLEVENFEVEVQANQDIRRVESSVDDSDLEVSFLQELD